MAPRYPFGEGPIDKIWNVIQYVEYAKLYLRWVNHVVNSLEQVLGGPVQPKPEPLKVESERGGPIR